MNKQKFIDFVENPDSVSDRDADILADLAQTYPYSSLVHTLLAKARKNSEDARSSLAMAAIYIPDRTVLKSVMENNAPATVEVKDAGYIPGQAAVKPSREPALVLQEGGQAKSNLSAENRFPETEPVKDSGVLKELEENLQKLKDQRERFNNSGTIPIEVTPSKATDRQDSTAAENEPVKSYSLPDRLQEVVESREENIIEDPKRIEQINLIDDFIRNSQSIARKYRSVNELPEEQSDLTGKNHFIPPDLATENLALIMVRQGKPEKAIDIYEKLVLKFPEKKAYFASCIEKLKNS